MIFCKVLYDGEVLHFYLNNISALETKAEIEWIIKFDFKSKLEKEVKKCIINFNVSYHLVDSVDNFADIQRSHEIISHSYLNNKICQNKLKTMNWLDEWWMKRWAIMSMQQKYMKQKFDEWTLIRIIWLIIVKVMKNHSKHLY